MLNPSPFSSCSAKRSAAAQSCKYEFKPDSAGIKGAGRVCSWKCCGILTRQEISGWLQNKPRSCGLAVGAQWGKANRILQHREEQQGDSTEQPFPKKPGMVTTLPGEPECKEWMMQLGKDRLGRGTGKNVPLEVEMRATRADEIVQTKGGRQWCWHLKCGGLGSLIPWDSPPDNQDNSGNKQHWLQVQIWQYRQKIGCFLLLLGNNLGLLQLLFSFPVIRIWFSN